MEERIILSNVDRERIVRILDDIMGSGKSTWAINYINRNPEKKFLCIVPLLDECKRYKENTDIDIIDPETWGSKWKHFRWLVENEKILSPLMP